MSVSEQELQEYRARARAWLQANLTRGHAAERGHGSESDEDIANEREIMAKICDAGYAGITVPKEYGGQGLTSAHLKVFNEEAGDYNIPTGGVTLAIVMPTLLKHGSEAQKKRYVPKMLRGEERWVQLFSEPGAGSDLAGLQTRAERQADGSWLLNGQKVWTTGAAHAEFGVCLARTDWDALKHEGISFFIVDLHAEGVTVRPIREINGGASFCEEFLDNVRLPADNLVGELGQGWAIANYLLSIERGGGGGDGPADSHMRGTRTKQLSPDLVAYASKRGVANDSDIRQLIATAHINDYMYNVLVDRVSKGIGEGKMDPTSASYIKHGLGLLQPARAKIAMEVAGAGAIAWTAEQEAEAITSTQYLNCRVYSIAGGSMQIQRNIISERILGLPREPAFDRGIPFREVQKRAKSWTGKV